MEDLANDLFDCGEDFRRVSDIEHEHEAFGRDGIFDIRRLQAVLQIVSNTVNRFRHRCNDGSSLNMSLAKVVRSMVHLTEDILDESTRLLKHLEKRKVKRFMVAAGEALKSSQSEHHNLRSVDKIRDMANEVDERYYNFVIIWQQYQDARAAGEPKVARRAYEDQRL